MVINIHLSLKTVFSVFLKNIVIFGVVVLICICAFFVFNYVQEMSVYI